MEVPLNTLNWSREELKILKEIPQLEGLKLPEIVL